MRIGKELLQDLGRCITAISKIFSNIRDIGVALYEETQEDPGAIHLTICLTICADSETYAREYGLWTDWFIHNISDENREFFALDLDRLEEEENDKPDDKPYFLTMGAD